MTAHLSLDLRSGLRSMRRSPLLTVAVVLTLALGIGATTAVFSVVRGVLLRPLPYERPDELVALWRTNAAQGVEEEAVPVGDFLDWRDRSRSLSALAAAEPYSYALADEQDPVRLRGWLVTPNFFEVLGLAAEHGRTFTADGDERSVVISSELFRGRFGGDPGVIGSTLRFDDEPYTLLGVMPPEFGYPPARDVWVPRRMDEEMRQRRGAGNLRVLARLAPAADVARARSEMDGIAAQLSRELPDSNQGVRTAVVPLREEVIGETRPALRLLLIAAVSLLLIALFNVVNLFLVRALYRRREFAVRAVLGASRARLLRQSLTETLLLTLAGSAGGLALAAWAVVALRSLGSGLLPRLAEVQLDGGVLLFALGVSVVTGIVLALAPGWLLSRAELQESLVSGSDGSRSATGNRGVRRLHSALVVAEVAFSLMLLVGAGLVVRTFMNLARVDLGFTTEGVAALECHVWSQYTSGGAREAFFREALEQIEARPGIVAAGAASTVPLVGGSERHVSFTIESAPANDGAESPAGYLVTATPGYLGALDVPIEAGRGLEAADREETAPVALVNRTLAERYWPGRDPIGDAVTVTLSGQTELRRIVGVVGDVLHEGPDVDPRPELYIPHAQYPFGSMTFVARGRGTSAAAQRDAKEGVRTLYQSLAFSKEATLDRLLAEGMAGRRLGLWLLGSFAVCALFLVAVGIHGVISFAVGQRRTEFGIRIALGARRPDLLRTALAPQLALVSLGLAFGLGAALLLGRFLQSLLFGVAYTDPGILMSISALLAAVSLLSGYLPVRRTLGADPVSAISRG